MAKLSTTLLGQSLHGSTGNVTFMRSRYGTQIRNRTIPRDPQTDAQWLARNRMTRAAATWREMSREQILAWNSFAQRSAFDAGIAPGEPLPTGQHVFTRLTTKVLQVDEQASIPVLPPSSPFTGDSVRLEALGLADAIRFTGSGANTAGVVTELLVQALASPNRRVYSRRFRSKRFIAFSVAGESVEVGVLRGWYAVAYRFVERATGQCTGLAVIGVVRVGS